ncbi:GNAT family N-acetyltransferase [Nocardioides sp. HDW12B]|uniref:GNAT family N-acetyltransferase n=1 Tax=Nocardioides sp. HDW12B TaxID=2714939 RepID=UPI00140D586B|nr:GNAT family N-acetyltransferase [Nocardioides sp. HDW12B]QIK67077.1 GNAT family N-acetyltransferase [Nocardioides sp. HDW12B]
MDVVLTIPAPGELHAVAAHLDAWQTDRGPVHLHPGDLGWYSMRGAERTAADLRVWSRHGRPVAVGLLDGPDGLLRLALDPDAREDQDVAEAIADDVVDADRDVLPGGEAVVEARGATLLAQALRARGWQDDEPWTPLHRDLAEAVTDTRASGSGVRVEVAGADLAHAWTAVHWSAFRGSPLSESRHREVVDWWRTMTDGPFAERGRTLVALDADDAAVAVAGVWSAGTGRPGLVEPMGVHRDHRGKGHGAAVCVAAAAALRELGSSSAVVCAETSNVGAVSTYVAAGFVAGAPVTDLRRGS